MRNNVLIIYIFIFFQTNMSTPPNNHNEKFMRQLSGSQPHFAPQLNQKGAADQKPTTNFFHRNNSPKMDFQRYRSLSVGSEGEPSSPIGSPQTITPPIAIQMNEPANKQKFYKELKTSFDFQ